MEPLKKEDYDKYVGIELNVDELNLIADLLKIETIYQIKEQVAADGKDVQARTDSIINTVTVYTEFDTQLKDLKASILQMKKEYATDPPISTVVVSLNRAKIYHWLCTKTIELTIPQKIMDSFNKNGSNLIFKLNEAIHSEPILDNSNRNLKIEDSSPKGVGHVKINMLGQKGQA